MSEKERARIYTYVEQYRTAHRRHKEKKGKEKKGKEKKRLATTKYLGLTKKS